MATTPTLPRQRPEPQQTAVYHSVRLAYQALQGLVWLWVLVGMASLPVNAVAVHPVDLVKLCKDADLVILGKVTSQVKLQPANVQVGAAGIPGWLMEARLEVLNVLKGGPTDRDVAFNFVLPDEGIGYQDVPVGTVGVFFLRKDGRTFEVQDPYYPYVPAGHGGSVTGDCLDRTVQLVAEVFQRSHGTLAQGRWARWAAVQAVASAPGPTATAALKLASADTDPLVRIWAISALMSRDDLYALKLVEKLGPVPRETDVQNLTSMLGAAISGVKDPRALPQLSRLLTSADVNVRRGAAAALANMYEGAAVRQLVRALNDSDQRVRYYAVVGLGRITGQNKWTPSVASFKKNEQRFLKHWRDWAKTNGYR